MAGEPAVVAAEQASDGPSFGRAAAFGLGVLTFINLFNYLDRYVLSALVESLKKEPELALTDARAGLLMTGFVIVYMAASPFFGALGDKRGRPRLIALGVGIWSIATMLGGLAHSFASLFSARAAVGIGEAAYATIAPALLADYYPKRLRGRVFSVFYAAIPLGSALGYILGGLMDAHFGWRAAFFVAGGPGILLALLCLGILDPPRGAHDAGEAAVSHAPPTNLAAYAALAKNVPYAVTVLGYAAYTFGLGGLAFWMPAFLERVRHVAKTEATVQFGAIVVVTGFLGTFGGGWLGDYCLRYTKQAYLWVSGAATLLAVPLAAVAFVSPEPRIYLAATIGAELLIFASTGPINSAIVNVVPPGMRATAVAVSIFAIHIFGDVPSPPAIGAISDATSLQTAVLIVPVVFFLAGLVWTIGAWVGDRRGWAA
ncbi:MAG TPA: MFS transporter [Myxococcales bacterium]|nr:MFS transporter [Myxococcales bacterium]